MGSRLKKRHRKRGLILETSIEPSVNPKYISNAQGTFFPPTAEFLRSDKFVIELENDHEAISIPSDRIKSFKFSSDSDGNKKIEITSLLYVDEWLDEFIDVNICKIYILNSVGKVVKYYDYDVAHCGHEYELKYSESDILMPKVYYTIFD